MDRVRLQDMYGETPQEEVSDDSGASMPGQGRTLRGALAAGIVGASLLAAVPATAETNSPNVDQTTAQASSNPFGFLDYAARYNAPDGKSYIALHGWAVDPDSPQAPEIHIWRDNQFSAMWGQTEARPDVEAAYPGAQRRGYNIMLEMDPNDTTNHKFCTYAINIGSGDTNTELGCAYVGIADPENLQMLADDPTWMSMSKPEVIERVKREYIGIVREMRETFADEGAGELMKEVAWFESAFGTNPNAYSTIRYEGLLQIDRLGDSSLRNPYRNIQVAESIYHRQGPGAWPNTSRMVLNGARSSHVFYDGTPAPEV